MQSPGTWASAALLAVLGVTSSLAAETAPWGKGKPHDVEHSPQRVVCDVSVADSAALSRVLNHVSYLNNICNADPFGSSIVLVLHGNEIPLFAIQNHAQQKALMTRAESLTVGGTVKFRMGRLAARGHGLEPEEIHGLVEIVPMADAEIVRLQQEEAYAHMR